MTADSQKDIQYLKAIGRICAEALRKMQGAVRAGMTTHELDEIGRAFLEAQRRLAVTNAQRARAADGQRELVGHVPERQSGIDRNREAVAHVRDLVHGKTPMKTPIVLSALGADAQVLGAVKLAIDRIRADA